MRNIQWYDGMRIQKLVLSIYMLWYIYGRPICRACKIIKLYAIFANPRLRVN